MTALLVAHQGGWDEILFVLAPLLVFAWLLRVARTRADAMEAERDAADGDGDNNPGADDAAEQK